MSDAPNYFRFHLGDFARDCEDLTMTQEGAYLRLMRWYYSTAKPLPADRDRIFRRCHALSGEEKAAVEHVLAEFFRLDGPIWRHKRIEEELTAWKARSDEGKEAARKRWKNTNEISGGVDADAYASALPTHMPPQCVGNANQNHNQNQELRTTKSKTLSGGAPDIAPKTSAKEQSIKQMRADAVAVLAFLNQKTGRDYKPVTANVDLIVARLKEGFTLQDCKNMIEKKVAEWKGDDKMDQFLRPKTLFNRTNFANYEGESAGRVGVPNGMTYE